MMTKTQTLIEHMIAQTGQEMNRLQEEAMEIVDQYWAWRTKENQARKSTEQSRLALRVHKREGGAFQVEWYAYELRRTKKGEARQRYISIHLPEPIHYPIHCRQPRRLLFRAPALCADQKLPSTQYYTCGKCSFWAP